VLLVRSAAKEPECRGIGPESGEVFMISRL
jgi:hypothetical protein